MIFLNDDGHGMPRIGTFPVTENGANGTVARGYYKVMGAGVYGQVGTCYQYLDNPGVYATFGFVNSGSITIAKMKQLDTTLSLPISLPIRVSQSRLHIQVHS